MTTREKIIVGVMCLTIVYGAYELFGARMDRKTTTAAKDKPVQSLQSFVADVTKKLIGEKIANEYQYIIAKADNNWPKDPFIQTTTPLKSKNVVQSTVEQPSKQSQRFPEFIYSGFLQLGDTKIAVINGMEYASGEALDTKGYFVKNISPQFVIIGKVKSPGIIKLPLSETDSGLRDQTQ